VFAEGCVPDDLNVTAGEYPMTDDVARTKLEEGTKESCHCTGTLLSSDGCYVAQSVGTTHNGDPMDALFVKINSMGCSTGFETVV